MPANGAAATSPTPTTAPVTASSPSAVLLTGQESLDRAAAALQRLQQKFLHLPTANSSRQSGTTAASDSLGQLRTPSDPTPTIAPGLHSAAATAGATAPAGQVSRASRSSFAFKLAVSGRPQAVGPSSLPHNIELISHIEHAYQSRGMGPDAPGGAPTRKESAGKESAGKESAGKESAGKESAATKSAGKNSVGKESEPELPSSRDFTTVRVLCPPSEEAETAPTGSAEDHSRGHADVAGQQQLLTRRHLPDAGSHQSHVLQHQSGTTIGHQLQSSGNQSDASSGSACLSETRLAGGGQPKQHKCTQLRMREGAEGSQEVDVYNLQSPGPIIVESAQVHLHALLSVLLVESCFS